MVKTVNVLISGFVQGIGFRSFVKSNAEKLQITGWVINLPDGRVEALLQGDEDVLKKMLKLCKKGPFLAEVKDIILYWQETKEKFKTFEIVTS